METGFCKENNITEEFLDSLQKVFRKDIPSHVLDKARRSLLDYIGVTLAATKALEEKLSQYMNVVEPEPGNTTSDRNEAEPKYERCCLFEWIKRSCVRFR